METGKILAATLLCLLIISCGGSGTNKKNESDSLDKRNIEILEKRKAEKQEKERKRKEAKEAQKEKFQRNNGNYRKPTQPKKDSRLRDNTGTNPVEEDPAKASAAKIEKRVQLELDIWKAKDRDDSKSVSKLREEADDLAKEMTQAELDAAYKRLKDIKKRM